MSSACKKFVLSGAALVLIGLCGACSSLSSALSSGDRVMVRLYDADNGAYLVLAHEEYPGLTEIYSERRADAAVKLAPEFVLEDLIEGLEAVGFGRLATPGPAPTAGVAGFVELRAGSEVRSFLVPPQGASIEQRTAFAQMKLVMDFHYGSVGGLQAIDNPAGAELFRRQAEALRAAGQARK